MHYFTIIFLTMKFENNFTMKSEKNFTIKFEKKFYNEI